MKRFLILLLLASPLYATEYNPWFSPLWEFQGRFSYFYDKEKTVQSPKGNFRAPSNDYTLRGSLGITPWPYWNAEVELFFTHTSDIPFSYEAAYGTIRYQWLDDIRGDPFALVTGLTLSFPGNRYLHDFSFTYHGEVNGELHVTIGKEWACRDDWWMRAWALGGWGIANQGSGWLHGIAALEFQPGCFQWSLFSEAIYGLGSNDIIPNQNPFVGFALIDHRTVNVGAIVGYDIGCLGTLSLLGWYNAYARNFVQHSWGLGATFLVPFSL